MDKSICPGVPLIINKDFSMSTRHLRFSTFLAPSIFPVYKFITEYIGQQLGYTTELVVGESFTA